MNLKKTIMEGKDFFAEMWQAQCLLEHLELQKFLKKGILTK